MEKTKRERLKYFNVTAAKNGFVVDSHVEVVGCYSDSITKQIYPDVASVIAALCKAVADDAANLAAIEAEKKAEGKVEAIEL